MAAAPTPVNVPTGAPAGSPVRALLAVSAVTSVEFLETGMVMFAASQIMAGVGLAPGQFALAYTLYAVSSILALYHHQWLAERLGYRRLVHGSLLLFALGALLCATAPGAGQFMVGRALQGLGGATFFTGGRMMLNPLPASQRFAGLLTFIGSLLGAMALAPLAAAGLLVLGGWPLLFLAVIPYTLLVGLLAHGQLSPRVTPPAERSEQHWGWVVWLVLGLFGMQYALQELPLEMATPGMLPASWLGLASLLLLTVFAWRQWRRDRPLIDYRGLWQWRYLLGLGFYFFGYFMAGSCGFLLPIFLQRARGLAVGQTALLIFFCQCASVAMALSHAALARRWPRLRLYMLAGLALFALGSGWLAVLAQQGSQRLLEGEAGLLWPMLLCGLAIPLYMGSVAFGTFSELPPKVFSHGYQVKNIVRQLGLSTSIALGTVLLLRGYPPEAEATLPLEAVIHGLLPEAALRAAAPLMAAASADVFAGLALATLPVAVLLLVQRHFR